MKLFSGVALGTALGAALLATPLIGSAASITLELKNPGAVQQLFLYTYDNSGKLTKGDSVALGAEGSAVFKRPGAGFNRRVYLVVAKSPEGLRKLGQLVASNEDLTVETELTRNGAEFKVTGGKENDALKAVQEAVSTTDAALQELYGTEGWRAKFEDRRQAEAKALAEVQKNYPKTLGARVAASLLRVPQDKPSTFLSQDDLTDAELISAMVPSLKYNRLIGLADEKTLLPMSQEFIDVAPKGKAGRELAYDIVLSTLMSIDKSLAKDLVNNATAEFPNNNNFKQIAAKLSKEKNVGDKLGDFAQADPQGKTLRLSDVKAKYVLVDFWASWCGPCRRENPAVVKAYNAYKDKGFTIFSVSLDDNKDKWLAAIEKDKLTWTWHTSDLKGWANEVSRQYGIESIPQNFLIDQQGVIVAKNLRGAALEAKLAEVLK